MDEQLREEIHKIALKLEHLETKFDNEFGGDGKVGHFYEGRKTIENSINKIGSMLEDQNTRIDALENWRSFLVGAKVIVVAVIIWLFQK